MREKEIDLLDLLVEILLRWRTIIVLMLIGGTLFAGVSYANSWGSVVIEKEQMNIAHDEEDEVSKEELEAQLTEVQINDVNNVWNYEQIYREKIAYQEKSFAQNIDPFNVPQADITFFVESDDLEKTYNIQKVYEDMMTSMEMYNYVQDQCETKYSVNELIWLEQTSYNTQNGSDIVRVFVRYDDEEGCQAIADTIVEYVMDKQSLLCEVLGEHSIKVLTQSITTVMMGDYITVQTNYKNEMMNYRNTITSVQEKFIDEQWRYFNYLSAGKAVVDLDEELEDSESNSVKKEDSKPTISIKYIVLGIFLFAFCYVFYIFVKYIMNNKLRPAENLSDLYDIPQLGRISKEEGKRRIGWFVDAWILSMRNRSERRFSSEESINMVAVAVKMATKKTSNNEVYLVGCDVKNQTADVCEKIKDILNKELIEVKVLDNILYNTETMVGLENAHCVVLIEKAGSTLYDEIAKELELLARQDITVLGGIVVE